MEKYQLAFSWLGVFLCLLIFGGMMTLISVIETITKPKILFYKKQRNLIPLAFIIFVSITILLFIIYLMNIDFISIFGDNWYMILSINIILIKIVISIIIGNEADKLGRNKYIWGLLAFIEFHLALIVLGSNFKLLPLKGNAKKFVIELNKETNTKIKVIDEAFKDGVIEYTISSEKINEIKSSYSVELKRIIDNDHIQNFNSKLEKALYNGIISQEEYNNKLQSPII